MKKFSLDTLETAKDHEINSIIMEQASETADKLTELECKLNKIKCYDECDNEISYTDEAQDIFNIFYDEEVDNLYKLLNVQLEIIK